MSEMLDVDVCVIGAGSGGLSVAAGAVQLGMSVALIEGGEMGGDCLNTGCVPSKALLAMGKKGVSFDEAHRHVKDVIKTIEPHDSQERFEGLGVKVFRSYARFVDKNRVITDQNDRIKARFIIIATGSSPFVPQLKGIDKEKILTNENIFDLKEKPDHLIIIGGGPIGVEMAQAHADLGCKVTVIVRGSLMAKDDPELVSVVRDSLVKGGVKLLENTAIDSVHHGDEEHMVSVTDKDGKTFEVKGSHILVAAGRIPNLDALDLEKAGIEYSEKGITVNKRLQASHKHIYAIGDVAGGPQFTHVAGYHTGIIIRNICFRMPAKVNYAALPWVTYTSPELANVGMTEAQALEKYGVDKIRTLTFPMNGNDRAIAENKTNGLIKIVGLKNGKILGAGLVGENAGELIGVWSLAISKGMKFSSVAGLILAYPTVSEVNKRVAGAWYTESLFSERTKKIVRWLQKFPIF